jgi:hypothetical protein
MDFNLPKETFVNKFIPKSKFFGKTILNTRLKNEFINKIQKITWKYKLSEETIGVNKTDIVEEIQIFEIELKKKIIPKNILKIVDRTIPYPILYIFIYEDDFAYGISLKDGNTQNYYFSDWNEPKEFNFTGINLNNIYQNIIKEFITKTGTDNKIFNDIIGIDDNIRILEKEIQILQNKIAKEKQFNRKVELNKSLSKKKKELDNILKQ